MHSQTYATVHINSIRYHSPSGFCIMQLVVFSLYQKHHINHIRVVHFILRSSIYIHAVKKVYNVKVLLLFHQNFPLIVSLFKKKKKKIR